MSFTNQARLRLSSACAGSASGGPLSGAQVQEGANGPIGVVALSWRPAGLCRLLRPTGHLGCHGNPEADSLFSFFHSALLSR